MNKIVVFNLRQTAGGGGGADTVIINTAAYIDSACFSFIAAYLRKCGDDTSVISAKLKEMGICYLEFSGSKFFSLKQFLNLVLYIRKYDVNIIHCHDPKSDLYGYLLKLCFPRLILVSTVHGWITRRFRSVLYNRLDMFLLRRFNAVIAVSENTRRIARSYGIRKTYLIHNSIDLNKWQPPKKDDLSEELNKFSQPFRIGFIGRISKEKGPSDFVHIAQKVLNQDANCEFLVAGEGNEEKAMKSLVKQFDLENKFRFLGLLSQSKLFDLYRCLDLLLLTSYTEGIPLVILEACAMRVPVVATRVGGVGEVVTHDYNGFLVNAGDIDSMARAALIIKNNKCLRDKFKDNGRFIVETQFSLAVNIRKTEGLYLRVAKRTDCKEST